MSGTTEATGTTDFTMPVLGADMESGTLLQWMVDPGDEVHKGQVVAVVDTAKAAIEVESFTDGVVDEILVTEGTQVPVGTPLARFRTGEGGTAEKPPKAEKPKADRPPEPERAGVVTSPVVRHHAEGLGVDLSGVVGTGPGGRITREDVDRAAVGMAPAAQAPAVPAQERRGEAAERATEDTAEQAPRPSAPPPERVTPAALAQRLGRGGVGVRAVPRARRLAAERGLDLASVTGTGPDGVVTAADVEAAAQAGAPAEPAEAPAPPPARDTGSHTTEAPSRREPKDAAGKDEARERQRAMRQAIGDLMARSKRDIPHLYLGTTVDMSRALAWLREVNAERPVTARVLPATLLLRATVLATREVPEVNGFVEDGRPRQADHVHLGVAVNLRGGGLVAPAIHQAESLALPDLMAALGDLVRRARAGRLSRTEMTEATLTVTNLGDQGVETVFGVIVPPQAALVGFGRIVERPWAENGLLGVRPVVAATLSADHRALDGHRGGLFLAAVDRLLNRPEEL